MDILAVPFHEFLKIERSKEIEYVFKLQERPEFLNHLGTIHACVQLSLAEATSGEFLQAQFHEIRNEVIPVVRKTEVKYRKAANGNLYSKVMFDEIDRESALKLLNTKNRVLIPIRVDIYDSQQNKTLTAVFEWFITFRVKGRV